VLVADPVKPSRARVLVVEPDARLGQLIVRYLAIHGFEATILAEPGQVVSELQVQRYACVVFNVGMAELRDVAVVAGCSVDDGTRVSPRQLLARIEAKLRDR